MKFEDIEPSIENLRQIGKGWRSIVYRGLYNSKDLAFKVATSWQTQQAIKKEGQILEKLKHLKNFPQVEMLGEDFVAYRYIQGKPLKHLNLSAKEKAGIYLRVLELAYLLDKMEIKKDEFQNLSKNLLVGEDGEVYLLDFERGCMNASKPHNVPQFLQLLVREGFLQMQRAIELGKTYRGDMEKVFHEIRAILTESV